MFKEQARRGVQNLEKEFSKNHNDMSALKLKIQKELNYSKKCILENNLKPDFEKMKKEIDSQYWRIFKFRFYSNQSQMENIEDLKITRERKNTMENEEIHRNENEIDLQKTSLKNLIEPSPNSNFIKDVFSGIDPSANGKNAVQLYIFSKLKTSKLKMAA